MKNYKINKPDLSIANEPAAAYYVNNVRNGIEFSYFLALSVLTSFTEKEWSSYLHVSERTLQRHKKEQKSFDSLHSEKILQIELLFRVGIKVFGSNDSFNSWLNNISISMGSIKPKSLLDSSFGINMVKDELGRIEHGISA